MSHATGAFDRAGLHVIATDIDVDDVADVLSRLQMPVDAVIDGDLALSPYQDAAENLFLGHEPRRFGLVDRGRMRREAAEVFASFGLDLSPVGPPDLSLGDRLVFACARVAARKARSCALTADRLDVPSESVLRACEYLTSSGVHVVLVGAAVGGFLPFANSITVVGLESGMAIVAGTCSPGPAARNDVVALLSAVGDSRAATMVANGELRAPGPVISGGGPDASLVLSVSEWTVPALPGMSHPVAERVNFDLRAGEVLAMTGHGSRELALSLFGMSMGPAVSGHVRLCLGPDAEPVDVGSLSASDALAAGLAYGNERPVSYDVGLLGGIPTSVSGATLKRLAASGVVDAHRVYRESQRPLSNVFGRAEEPTAFTEVLRSWSTAGPAVVVLDEPFLSDRAARLDAVEALAARGAGIVIVSSRPTDIASVAHRLIVIRCGMSVPDTSGRNELGARAVLERRLR